MKAKKTPCYAVFKVTRKNIDITFDGKTWITFRSSKPVVMPLRALGARITRTKEAPKKGEVLFFYEKEKK